MPGGQALSGVEARLAAIEDREAIRDLIARYGMLADAGDAAGAAALWAEDGGYEVGGHGVHTGRAAIAALLESEMHLGLIARGAAHVLSAPVIELDGDTALARCYSCVFRHDSGAWTAHRVAANLWRLERGPRGWQVRHRINRLLDGDEAARQLIAGGEG